MSRHAPAEPVDGVDYVSGSVVDAGVLDAALIGRDAVLVPLSPRGGLADLQIAVLEDLIARLTGTATRLGYVGGMSSLLAEAGGRQFDHLGRRSRPRDPR